MNIQLFDFENQPVRIIKIDNDPWFVGKDVATILGYANPSKAVSQHVDHEDKQLQMIAHSQNGNVVTQTALINESGLYSLILSSKLTSAKKFKRWVTSEVLPALRKDGAYVHATEDDDDVMLMAKGMLAAQRAIERKDQLIEHQQQIIAEQKPKVIFADAVSASSNSILIRELAVILKQNGIDIGQTRLFEWLREEGYLVKRRGSDYNTPTQKSMNLGLFEIKETPVHRSSGTVTISKTPKVTGKGQQYFINKFLQRGDSA